MTISLFMKCFLVCCVLGFAVMGYNIVVEMIPYNPIKIPCYGFGAVLAHVLIGYLR